MLETIKEVMNELALAKRIFVSEADFQHSFAWELHKKFEDAKILLEYPAVGYERKNIHVDIYIKKDNRIYFVELKYKTKPVEFDRNEIDIPSLKHQSAPDIGRRAFLVDIERLEKITSCDVDYCLLLTNDAAYWKDYSPQKLPKDNDFRLHEGKKIISGKNLDWRDKNKKYNQSDKPINLRNDYPPCSWNSYVKLNIKSGEFKYLLVEIKNKR